MFRLCLHQKHSHCTILTNRMLVITNMKYIVLINFTKKPYANNHESANTNTFIQWMLQEGSCT